MPGYQKTCQHISQLSVNFADLDSQSKIRNIPLSLVKILASYAALFGPLQLRHS